MSLHTEIVGWINRHKHRIGLIAFGHTAKKIEEYFFDWFLYGTVVIWATATYGPTWGALVTFLIMAPLSALLCHSYIRFYDWVKKDWLGLETLEELRESEATSSRLMRFFIRIAKWGDVPMFFFLSINGDPFMTTIYFRRGAHLYNGMWKRDWYIFCTSVLLSNAYWTLRWAVILQVVIFVWHWLQTTF